MGVPSLVEFLYSKLQPALTKASSGDRGGVNLEILKPRGCKYQAGAASETYTNLTSS
jgi:hypothetical protein